MAHLGSSRIVSSLKSSNSNCCPRAFPKIYPYHLPVSPWGNKNRNFCTQLPFWAGTAPRALPRALWKGAVVLFNPIQLGGRAYSHLPGFYMARTTRFCSSKVPWTWLLAQQPSWAQLSCPSQDTMCSKHTLLCLNSFTALFFLFKTLVF